MSVEAQSWAFATRHESGQKAARKFVLVALADYADSRGACYPSLRLLAQKCEMAINTVRDRLDELVAAGFVYRTGRVRDDGSHSSNEYVLLINEAARAYAAEKGWRADAPLPPPNPKRKAAKAQAPDPNQLEIFASSSSSQGAVDKVVDQTSTHSDCSEGGGPAGRSGVVQLAGVREPSHEPSHEPFPQTPDDTGAAGRQGGSGPDQGEEPDLWPVFSCAFPARKTDFDAPARALWNRLTRDERAAAARFAPQVLEACRAAGHSNPMHRKTYLRERAWEKFAVEDARQDSALTQLRARIQPSSDFHRRLNARLEATLGSDAFLVWFNQLEVVAVANGAATLSLPTKFLHDWVEREYSRKLLAAARVADPDVTRIALMVRGPSSSSGARDPPHAGRPDPAVSRS